MFYLKHTCKDCTIHNSISFLNGLVVGALFCIHSTHWDRVTHIWVSKLTVDGSDKPTRRQAILGTSDGIVNWTIRNSVILIKSYIFRFKIVHLKMPSGNLRLEHLSRPQCVTAAVLAEAIFSIRPGEMTKWLIAIYQDRYMGTYEWRMQYRCTHWNAITSKVMEIWVNVYSTQ